LHSQAAKKVIWVCVGFLQAERKDGRIGAKEGQSKRLEGEKRMLAEFDRHWNQLAQEVLSGMRGLSGAAPDGHVTRNRRGVGQAHGQHASRPVARPGDGEYGC
jgi:hypothetical protein